MGESLFEIVLMLFREADQERGRPPFYRGWVAVLCFKGSKTTLGWRVAPFFIIKARIPITIKEFKHKRSILFPVSPTVLTVTGNHNKLREKFRLSFEFDRCEENILRQTKRFPKSDLFIRMIG